MPKTTKRIYRSPKEFYEIWRGYMESGVSVASYAELSGLRESTIANCLYGEHARKSRNTYMTATGIPVPDVDRTPRKGSPKPARNAIVELPVKNKERSFTIVIGDETITVTTSGGPVFGTIAQWLLQVDAKSA